MNQLSDTLKKMESEEMTFDNFIQTDSQQSHAKIQNFVAKLDQDIQAEANNVLKKTTSIKPDLPEV